MANCFNTINARTIAMLVCLAFLLFKILASIVTPCSVKASGNADFGRLTGYVITKCDDIFSHSVQVI